MATYKHIRSSTANKRPTTAIADGQIAINTNTASPGLFFKDSAGTGIVKVGPVHVGTTAPNSTPGAGGSTGNYTGEQWLDTSLTPAQLKVWNGSQWVGVVADELPVSKLQDGAARQLLQTDAAGTGVEWTSNVDVPGTLDVTSTATFDSIAQHPVGSAAAPTITFTGDTNTGIYSPGADQLALSTNGTGRLFVDANGRVGVGVASPAVVLDTASADECRIRVRAITNGVDTRVSSVGLSENAGVVGTYSNHPLVLFSNNAERLRITSAGLVGIGTSSPAYALHVNTTSPTYDRVALFQSNTANSFLGFGTSGGSGENQAEIGVAVADLVFNTQNQERLRITSAGLVGIGTSTPAAEVHLAKTAAPTGETRNALRITAGNTFGGEIVGYLNQGVNAGIAFSTVDTGVATERMRITPTGVGIGTTSPGGTLDIKAATSTTPLIVQGSSSEFARIESSGRLLVGTSANSGGALLQVNGNRIRVATAKTPASATDTGTAGEICWDASYIYVCTATNTWKRTALSTW